MLKIVPHKQMTKLFFRVTPWILSMIRITLSGLRKLILDDILEFRKL